MGNKKDSSGNDMQRILDQYKDTMRSLVKQGKLTHRELEKNLTDVIDQMASEAKKVTAEIIEEEVRDARKKNTKNVPAPVVEGKPESMPKTQK